MSKSLRLPRHGHLALSTLFLLLCCAQLAVAGGIQDVTDLTNPSPSPVPGEVTVPTAPLFWDARCIPVNFRVNNSMDPIPNPLGEDFLSVEEVIEAFQEAADSWTEIPTSFIDLRVIGTVNNPGLRRFDQINEITFRTFQGVFPPVPAVYYATDSTVPIGISRPTRLAGDFDLPDNFDLDGDGDPDVSSTIETCQDLDGDGDTEYPAGLYKAGTILDVDIILNAGVTGDGSIPLPGYRFTVDDGDLDMEVRSVDLRAIAVQALGIGQGLAHVATNQTSDSDGTAGSLFPVLDTSDPVAQLTARQVDVDAQATSSLLYPEGSAPEGPAALQAGDRPFEADYGLITGEVFNETRDEPMLGAHVVAIDQATKRVVSSAISGRTQLSVTPDNRGTTFLDADYHALDGMYVLPVPPGTYTVMVEASDNFPIHARQFNLPTIIALEIGQNDFEEDTFNGPGDSALEFRPGAARAVAVQAGGITSGVDVVTNEVVRVGRFGSLDEVGLPGDAGNWYAVRISAADYLAAASQAGPQVVVQGGAFFTGVADASVVPTFDQAVLTTGSLQPDGTAVLELAQPLVGRSPFVGQENDFAPFWFSNSNGLAQEIEDGIQDGTITDLFLALKVGDGPFPGISGEPPYIGLDGGTAENDVPIYGDSFISQDGHTFVPSTDYNFLFKLFLSQKPQP